MRFQVALTFLSAVFSVCTASKCLACSKEHAEIEAVRLEAVKSQILNKLGLSTVPNVTSRRLPKIPPLLSMLESEALSARRPAETQDDYHAKTERMIAFPKRENHFLVGKAPNWWYFDFTWKKSRLKVTRSALWVYLKKSTETGTGKENHHFKVNVYQGVHPLDKNNTPGKALILSRQFSSNDSGWQHFKLKRVVKGWVQESSKNLGLFVELVGADADKMVGPGEDPNLQPFLVLHTQDIGNKRRAKRMAGIDCDDPKKPSRNTCCKHSLTIDFDLIGWHFVIAPKKYDAFYCTGECSGVGYSLHRYFNTHFVYKELKRRGEKTTFCCSPSKVSSITMLYLLNDKIMYEKVPRMTVEACGCS